MLATFNNAQQFWILLILCSTALTTHSFASTKTDKKVILAETNILIDLINHTPDQRVDSNTNVADWLGYRTEGGGQLYAYRLRDSICKIVADMVHAFGMVRVEFYYNRGTPVFLYEREDYFPVKDSIVDRTKLEYGHEARYYVHNGTLVDSNRRGKDKFGAKTTPAEAVRKLLLMSDRFYGFMNRK